MLSGIKYVLPLPALIQVWKYRNAQEPPNLFLLISIESPSPSASQHSAIGYAIVPPTSYSWFSCAVYTQKKSASYNEPFPEVRHSQVFNFIISTSRSKHWAFPQGLCLIKGNRAKDLLWKEINKLYFCRVSSLC